MSIYTFDLLLHPDTIVDEAFYDALAINDCLDCLVTTCGAGPVELNFVRAASSEEKAICLAQEQMAKAGFTSTVRKFSKCSKLDCGQFNCQKH